MRAGLYARVSTTEQAEEGYSIEAQIEAMRRYCQVEGWTVAAEYIDSGWDRLLWLVLALSMLAAAWLWMVDRRRSLAPVA